MIKIVDYSRQNGTLRSVTVEVSSAKDNEIYKKFLESERPDCTFKCATCGEMVYVTGDPMRLRIDNPLTGGFLALALPVYQCEKCNAEVRLSSVDYTAFPTVMEFLKLLRKKEAERKKNGKK